jgi:hypothetical protein
MLVLYSTSRFVCRSRYEPIHPCPAFRLPPLFTFLRDRVASLWFVGSVVQCRLSHVRLELSWQRLDSTDLRQRTPLCIVEETVQQHLSARIVSGCILVHDVDSFLRRQARATGIFVVDCSTILSIVPPKLRNLQQQLNVKESATY